MTSVPSPEEVRSEEAWLACGTCVRLVNESDPEGLVLRAAHDELMGIREELRPRVLGSPRQCPKLNGRIERALLLNAAIHDQS